MRNFLSCVATVQPACQGKGDECGGLADARVRTVVRTVSEASQSLPKRHGRSCISLGESVERYLMTRSKPISCTLLAVIGLLAISVSSCKQELPAESSQSQPSQSQPNKMDNPDLMASATPAPIKLEVPMFGEVTINDGELLLMDGGIHGVQGHRLRVPPTGAAAWDRSVDSFHPSGKAGAGELVLTSEERATLKGSADALWELAANGQTSFDQPIEKGPPRWVWAIVLRRGDEVRVLSGGDVQSPAGAPEAAKSVLTFLVERVDG